ncbi:MAG TPA: glycosyltransferase, partial [Myxococcaceae bacterium]
TRRTYEIVVVDTVQRLDATPDVCTQHGVRYLARSPTNSFGDAVRTGIAAAAGRWIIFMDADGSHAPEFIPQLLEHGESSDIVIASRYIQGGHTENTWALKQMSRVLNLSYSIILNLKVKDVSNSFKLYRADLLREPALRCQNFDIIEELLFKISRAHRDVRIKEVPFTFKKRMFGETKRSLLLFILTYLFTMLKLRFDWGAKPRGPGSGSVKRWPHVMLSLVVFLANMIGAGYRAIWQDEAETATRASTILESGWPRVIDKSGAVSVNTGGDEIEEGVTHRYTPWGQFYLGAAGLALGEVTPMGRDTSLRMPFIAAHAASSGLLSYGLAAFTGAPLPLALAAGTALSLQTVRTLHDRTARYHAVLDVLSVLGAFAVGGLRRGRRWALPVWGATLFLAPHFHTMGGSVVAAVLGLWGVSILACEAPGLGGLAARARAAVLYGLVPGAISLALLVWLVRPSQHAHWGAMSPIELSRLWPSRSLSDRASIAYVTPFVALSIAGLLALRRWWAAGLLALTTIAVALTVGALDFHPFSQFRYYLFLPVLAMAWPVALGLGQVESRRWVAGMAAGAIAVNALIPDVWLANVSTPPPFPPFQGLRLLASDAAHRFAGDRQPLHEAVALIQQRSAPGDPVVFDYVPQFVNWYLPGHPVALMPDWTAKNPLNEHNPIWDKPVAMPRWHVWYTNYVNGTWKCSGRCDYGIGNFDPGRGAYVLHSRRLGQSVPMCIVGAWPTHQWNNAPFIDYSPDALTPSGPRTVVLVVGTPCPATAGQGN